jgi:bifunctional UDP-N-acetylglucosamine pyrophosphorylase/glucosamine-1-phosphate N-acetyltransferase
MSKPLDVVVMAAGLGTRMKSQRPKVLHQLAGRALVWHVIATVAALSPRTVVVVTGSQAEQVEAALAPALASGGLRFARQEPKQLGTGHAVQQAMALLADDGITLVLSGDVPLTEQDTLRALVAASMPGCLALLTVDNGDAGGYGRVLREDGRITGIVEHRDASAEQRRVTEWYSGIMALPTALLRRWLARLMAAQPRNAQGEYYLTDIVAMAAQDGVAVLAHNTGDLAQVQGVNNPGQLAELERVFQLRQARRLMEQGVRIMDPARFDLRGALVCAQDVEIDVNCLFEGQVSLGEGVRIGANCVIANARIEAGALVHPFTHIDGEALGVSVGAGARVGPFARLRPGARLGEQVHVGNFVEIKNATLGSGSKANHLAYIGDASVGARVNYGAGSITANYDGANKHVSVIEDDVHVGSNCVLVAPLTLGPGGTVGAGSVITRDTPAGALSLTRAKMVQVANWKRPAKGKR